MLDTLTPDGKAFADAYGPTLGADTEHIRGIVEQTLALAVRCPREPMFGGYLVEHKALKTVVGTCGFRNGPLADGSVEIAYHTFEPFEGRGYSTASAQAMITLASKHPAVRRIIAHTLATPGPSPRILEKVGMRFLGVVEDPEDGPVWGWEISPCR